MQEEAKAEETLNGLWTSIPEDEDDEGGNGRENTKVFETEVAGVVELGLEVVFEVVVVAEVEVAIIVICELLSLK